MFLDYQADWKKAREYCMANGKVIRSMGQVTLKFQLPCWKAPRSIEFQVLEELERPVIFGAELAIQMSKLDRLPCTNHEDSAPRVTHLSRKGQRPTRVFRCLVDDKMVEASADTGSDLSLISPLAVSKLSGAGSMRTENFDITLADKSKAHIDASFRASFSPYSASKETVTERFYILEGLTADIFLSRHILDKIGAFTRNQASFSDSLGQPMLYNLNVAAYLSEPSANLLSIFRTGRRATTKTDASSAKPTLQNLPPPSTPDGDFYAALKVVAAYETHRREKARVEIAGLSGVQKAIAEDAEKRRIERYETDLKSRLDERTQAANNAS
ncbi:uncharacterized protein Z518_06553 [Rhinocladiella mackenziei CBS 650.93]|uniref:Uncharacterized protein n=1 Tax=Rhinocladiella mackenziei CBS 650.93 TaxID=1442369 RepID=A0A0D2GXX2_9EURO|nr:uncharacterized protein Z518_06553 [Rhinocladiella mackenziei CBS 650.93]KIX03003.1 hypothetical protein Z518_06553 [Rhinocladiella mackenziei CBS 650.93]